jgi:hypothetical protein
MPQPLRQHSPSLAVMMGLARCLLETLPSKYDWVTSLGRRDCEVVQVGRKKGEAAGP